MNSQTLTTTGDLRKIYWTAFLLRFTLGCGVWFVARGSSLTLLEDALYYEAMGASVAQDWLAGRSSLYLEWAIQNGTTGWIMVVAIACVYWVTAGIRAIPVLIAIFAAVTAYSPVLTYRITARLGGGTSAARVAAGLVTFSPCFVFWAGALYKEGLIVLLLNLAVLHTLHLMERWRWRSFVLVVFSIAVLFGLRFYLAMLLGATILACLPLATRARGGIGAASARFVTQGAIVFAILTTGVLMNVPQRLSGMIPQSESAILGRLNVVRQDLSTRAGSGFLSEVDISTRANALAFAPVGSAYFLTVPLPWQAGSLRQNAIIPETLLWILLYPLVLYGLLRTGRRHLQATILLVVFTASLSLFYGLYVGNIGTAYRMRTQVWLLWAVFAGIGWESWRLRAKHRVQHEIVQR